MKKILCSILGIMMLLTLCSCGKETVQPQNETITEGNSDNAEEESEVLSQNEDIADEESALTADMLILKDEYNVFVKNGDEFTKIYDAYESVEGNGTVPFVSSAEIIGDYIYILSISYSDDSHLYVYEKDGKMYDDITVSRDMSMLKLDEYEGKVCISYCEYVTEDGNNISRYTCNEYNPDDKTLTKNDEYSENMTSALNMDLSTIGSLSYFGMLKQYGGVYRFDFGTHEIVKLDEKGTILEKTPIEGEHTYVSAVFSDYALTYTTLESEKLDSEVVQQLYNMNTKESVELYRGKSSDTLSFLSADDEYMYYYTNDSKGESRCNGHYYIKRYNLSTKESEDLYDCIGLPGRGTYYALPGVSGFTLSDSNIYYIYYTEDAARFFAFNPEDKSVKETEAVVHNFNTLKYADVDSIYEEVDYPEHEGVLCYYFYDELVRIKDTVKNADKINAALEKYEQSLSEVSENEKNNMLSVEYYDDYAYYSSIERKIEDIKEIGSRYLLVAYDTYYYGGGAHGMNYKSSSLFDLETGEEVYLKDLTSLSEEEFKKVVADATIEDWKNDESYKYFNSYSDNPGYEQEFYDELYEQAEFSMLMTWSDDGIIIMYMPYQYGSYATGYICIPIPYEKVGVEME